MTSNETSSSSDALGGATLWGEENVRLYDDLELEVRWKLSKAASDIHPENFRQIVIYYDSLPRFTVPVEVRDNIRRLKQEYAQLEEEKKRGEEEEEPRDGVYKEGVDEVGGDEVGGDEVGVDDEGDEGEEVSVPSNDEVEEDDHYGVKMDEEFPGFRPSSPIGSVSSISSIDSRSEVRPKENFWPNMAKYIKKPSGLVPLWPTIAKYIKKPSEPPSEPVPVVVCVFCNYRLVVPGLQEQNGIREPMRKLGCGHVVGEVCFEACKARRMREHEDGIRLSEDLTECPIGRCVNSIPMKEMIRDFRGSFSVEQQAEAEADR